MTDSDAAGLIIACALLIYFLPTVVASFRKHRNTGAIFVLNLFLGWTFSAGSGRLSGRSPIKPRTAR